MSTTIEREAAVVAPELMLGDEAVALGAIDAGITGAYAYPGTPSTEIFARVIAEAEHEGHVTAHWCANEKSSMEAALGCSLAGRRALVTMKHVGLNVAADPFMNAPLLGLGGGLVIAVADDPGMHSSQNEQDTRYYGDFARALVLEPATAQEAYAMTVEAFELSERFRRPVLLRLVTRLCHERAGVVRGARREQNAVAKATPPQDWTLLPVHARRLWKGILEQEPEVQAWSAGYERTVRKAGTGKRGVLTAGIARRYYLEVADELDVELPHLHLAAYPIPEELLRDFCAGLDELLVVEEGYPFLETRLRGVLGTRVAVRGKTTGHLPPDGELTPGLVGRALGLPTHEGLELPQAMPVPPRPPQLCQGCVHSEAYAALDMALAGYGERHENVVAGDIGCYTLGALSPYRGIDSCVCMGASIGMAKGAADAGLKPAVGVIGDSTFLHSGVAPLMDAASHDTDMVVLILDNETVAMTGGQPTVLRTSRLKPVVLGVGCDPDHVHEVHAKPKGVADTAALIKKEIEHPGLSVIIIIRECVQTARQKKAEKAKEERR